MLRERLSCNLYFILEMEPQRERERERERERDDILCRGRERGGASE